VTGSRRAGVSIPTGGGIWNYISILFFNAALSESVFKEKHGVCDPMPELINFPYLIIMSNPMPELTLTP
jgi:hypothetical protein